MDIQTEHIIAYLEGRLSVNEQKEIEQLVEKSPEFGKEVNDIRFIWQVTAELNQHKRINTDKNWKQLSWRIKLNKNRRRIGRFIRSSAAILFIPLLIGSYFLYDMILHWNDQVTEQIELTTAYGLVSKVILPDSSEVWLNSGSTISYPKQFSGLRRTVELSGEAYFRVTSSRVNRFDVKTPNGITVSAYGTEFNVSAYEDDSQVEATLVKGNIEFGKDSQTEPYILNPGQQAVFSKEKEDIQLEKANILVKTAWKDGKLVFRRTPLVEVAKRLSRRFNVEIKMEGEELYEYEYSMTFTTETLDEIVFFLEKSAPIKCWIIEPEQTGDFSFSKRKVIIRGR